jgi:hypothetical protein
MNYKQKIVITIAAITLASIFLYVPWRTYVPLDTPQGNIAETRDEYRLFNSPPDEPMALKAPQIVWAYSCQKAAIILLANALLVYLVRTKKQNRKASYAQSASPHAAF